MASEKIRAQKQEVVNEIVSKLDNNDTAVIFEYQGLSVDQIAKLRKDLRDVNGEVKIYKNTLLKIALDSKNHDVSEHLEGANAIVFGNGILEPIKALSEFGKANDAVKIKTGIVNGEIVTLETINEYASIPSMEGLLTMLAGGMIGIPKDLAICLDLHAKNLEENN